MAKLDPEFDRNVFINCPFDAEYAPIFEAIVFAVHDAGFRPKCARERLDSSEIRLQKIVELIRHSRYSIHDLSRTELDKATSLPRFNMPLELGIDLGCKSFSSSHRRKSLLIFDSEQYRFQKYVSDIGGQDVQRHNNDAQVAVARVRDWLRAESGRTRIPGGSAIYGRYITFRGDLPASCKELRLDVNDLTLWTSRTPSPSGLSVTRDFRRPNGFLTQLRRGPVCHRRRDAAFAATNEISAGSVCKRRDAMSLGRLPSRLGRRANERPAVNCCEELGRARFSGRRRCRRQSRWQTFTVCSGVR